MGTSGHGGEVKKKALTILAFALASGMLSSAAYSMSSKPVNPNGKVQANQQAIAQADRDFRTMDSNRDGVVTRIELDAFVVSQNPQIDGESRRKLVDMMLLRFDLDKNGAISRTEALKAASGGR